MQHESTTYTNDHLDKLHTFEVVLFLGLFVGQEASVNRSLIFVLRPSAVGYISPLNRRCSRSRQLC